MLADDSSHERCEHARARARWLDEAIHSKCWRDCADLGGCYRPASMTKPRPRPSTCDRSPPPRRTRCGL